MLILNRSRNVIYLLCTAFLLLCFQSAQAAPSAGITVSAKGRVTSTSPGQRAVQLKRRSPFGRSDTLATGAGSRGIFKFKDGTVFRLNPRSKVVINQYQYKPGSKRGKLNIRISNNSNLLYISGKMPKSNVRIKTSLGILGLRGTFFNLSSKGLTVGGGVVTLTDKFGKSITIEAGQTLSITGSLRKTPPSEQAALQQEGDQVRAEAGVPASGGSGGGSSSNSSTDVASSSVTQAAASTQAIDAVKTITIEINPEEE